MFSNSVCNHTRDKLIGLPLRGRPIWLSLVRLRTELDSIYSCYHYLNRDFFITIAFFGFNSIPPPLYKKSLPILVPNRSLCALRRVDIFTPRGANGHEV